MHAWRSSWQRPSARPKAHARSAHARSAHGPERSRTRGAHGLHGPHDARTDSRRSRTRGAHGPEALTDPSSPLPLAEHGGRVGTNACAQCALKQLAVVASSSLRSPRSSPWAPRPPQQHWDLCSHALNRNAAKKTRLEAQVAELAEIESDEMWCDSIQFPSIPLTRAAPSPSSPEPEQPRAHAPEQPRARAVPSLSRPLNSRSLGPQ